MTADAHEQTPLIGANASYRHAERVRDSPRPGSANDNDDAGTETDDDDDDIDPDDFDLLLNKSTSFNGGPVLGPESIETPLLRGERKYSTGYGTSARGVFGSRRPSIASAALTEDDEHLDRPGGGGGGAAAAAAGGAGSSKAASPFHGGISYSRFWLIFSNVLALNFICNFDSTLMASSHPVITSYFNSSNSASWLSTAFLLTSTAFQPLLGSLSDTLGRKTPYIFTMTVFALATLWCALAQSMTSFIAARAVCGLGAGGVMTLGSIIVSDLVPIEHRGAYQSYINAVYGIGATLGAALGGFMADYLGWRWEFGIQVAPLLLCVGVSAVTIPHDLGLSAMAAEPRGGRRATFVRAMQTFDFKGSLLLTSAITFLILGLNLGGNVLPWSHPFVMASLAIFAVSFPLFIYADHKPRRRPIMPLHLIRHSPQANMIFSNALSAFLMNAIIFNMPLFFQAVLLTSATTSGFCLMIITVFSSCAGTATGFLINWSKRLKWPMTLGTWGFLVGTIVLSSMQRGWPLPAYLLCLVPHSLGQGFQFPGTFMALLAASDPREQATATSTLILWRSMGMVLGIAGSSLVVQNSLWRYLDRFVTDEAALSAGYAGGRMEVVEMVRESVEAVGKLAGSEVREQVVRSYEAAVRTTFLCCVGVAVVGVLLVLPVRLPRLGARKK
ncbi:major facilitator superfamily domain-containing protein [Coniella lustricola]|uniref:Major facilitator superfamily domain-containing protein n=1 Tax=Coniella lustricola TaxID=2025994 RepID=A0A2T3AHE8_9PEZI|nr:major facilitator superfamily domain-containing protein [Coniella lustricola]